MNKPILFVPKLGKNGDTKSESFLRRSYFTDKQLFRIPFSENFQIQHLKTKKRIFFIRTLIIKYTKTISAFSNLSCH